MAFAQPFLLSYNLHRELNSVTSSSNYFKKEKVYCCVYSWNVQCILQIIIAMLVASYYNLIDGHYLITIAGDTDLSSHFLSLNKLSDLTSFMYYVLTVTGRVINFLFQKLLWV